MTVMRVTKGAMAALIDQEQAALWADLAEGIRMAMNHVWSIRCEAVSRRLVRHIRAVGAIHPDRIEWRLYAGGIYDMLVGFAGDVPQHYDVAEFERVDAQMAHTVSDLPAHVLFRDYERTRQQMLRYRKDITED